MSEFLLCCVYDLIYDDTTGVVGERAKRARHSHVCSIENRGYIYILGKWFPFVRERAHS